MLRGAEAGPEAHRAQLQGGICGLSGSSYFGRYYAIGLYLGPKLGVPAILRFAIFRYQQTLCNELHFNHYFLRFDRRNLLFETVSGTSAWAPIKSGSPVSAHAAKGVAGSFVSSCSAARACLGTPTPNSIEGRLLARIF